MSKLTNVPAFNADAYADAMGRFKTAMVTAETTAENGGSLLGRATLAGIINGDYSPASVALDAYRLFNPVSAKGKASEPKLQGERVLSVSSLRNAKGGDNARKQLDALFHIAATVEGDADSKGANIVLPAIAAFINEDKGAAKSLRTLASIVNDAMKAHNALNSPVKDDADNGDAKGEGEGDNSAAPVTLREIVETALEYWNSKPEQRADAETAIAALFDAVFATTAASDEGERKVA